MPTRREGNIVQHLQSMEEGLALAEPDFGFNTSFQSEIICKRFHEPVPARREKLQHKIRVPISNSFARLSTYIPSIGSQTCIARRSVSRVSFLR